MTRIIKTVLLFFIIISGLTYALEPNEILVIANSEIPVSEHIAQYYCQQRAVPADNLVLLPLGKKPANSISRTDYDEKIVNPLRNVLNSEKFSGKIKCLLTIYGVPVTVGGRGQLKGNEEQLKKINELIAQGKKVQEKLKDQIVKNTTEQKNVETKLAQLQAMVDIIKGKETNASLDSELSMVLIEGYELYRWQVNPLQIAISHIADSNDKLASIRDKIMMVSRLDGPSEEIIMSLIDKAIRTEKTGLKGIAYFDSRAIIDKDRYGEYDQSLRDIGFVANTLSGLPVKQEQSKTLFEPNSCPETAIYCGWYSLKKYIDAFDFVDGAVGYHIASFEAQGLRDINSQTWCPAMLKDGITATLGPVAEPYLHTFPKPKDFFTELFNGYCLVETYYRTKPYNSWMMVLIGDPLYKPFKQRVN
ncbi:MAG: TIGR03790 family protein [Sedimentisphaerales bacterium]|nr:TIGR03790 family protein [Sedimentisphaerales bacterium]